MSERKPSGATSGVARAALELASHLYGAGATLHRLVYQRGWREPQRLDCRVISVGSITLGGAGKTPFAAWLARALQRRGVRVAVASRGYGRRGSEPVVVVSDGLRISADLDRAGDEPLWLAAQLPGVPVLVGRDRGRVGRAAHAMFGVEVVVLDDGMQHYRLARDVEIAVLDGRDGVGNGWCVPRGRLREPLAGLARADAIVVLSGPLRPDHEARVAAAAPDALRISGSRRATQLAPIDGLADPGARLSLDWLRGREVGALAAIAQPSALVASLENLGAKVVALRAFRDHRRYRARDLRGLAREAPVWVTTEKDALKLRPSWLRGAGLFVLGEEIEIEAADRMLAWLAQRLATR